MDKHICYDLDSTLVCSFFEPKQIDSIIEDPRFEDFSDRIKVVHLVDSDDKNPRGVGLVERFLVVLRPHVREFLNYADKAFGSNSIWSAGQFKYVRGVEYLLFPPHLEHLTNFPQRVLTRDQCEFDENFTFILKPLASKNFDLKKTLIVDDRDDTFSKNHKNGIHIPVYLPEPNLDSIGKDDPTLLELIDWFKNSGVLESDDVRTIDKTGIFSRPIR